LPGSHRAARAIAASKKGISQRAAIDFPSRGSSQNTLIGPSSMPAPNTTAK